MATEIGKDDAWAAKQFEDWDEFVDEVVQVGKRQELRIAKRNLERKVFCRKHVRYFAHVAVAFQRICRCGAALVAQGCGGVAACLACVRGRTPLPRKAASEWHCWDSGYSMLVLIGHPAE